MSTYSLVLPRVLFQLKSCVQFPARGVFIPCLENVAPWRVKLLNLQLDNNLEPLRSSTRRLFTTSSYAGNNGSISTRTYATEVGTNSGINDSNDIVSVVEKRNFEPEFEDEEEKKQFIWESGPVVRVSYNLAAFVNESETLQKLVDLKVDLAKLDLTPDIGKFIVKLDFKTQVAPYIRFLSDNGVTPEFLGFFITKNPNIFKEDLENLKRRIEYLRSKKFLKKDIGTIISRCPKWLSYSVPDIDTKLGFFQNYFELTGKQVRQLFLADPKLVTMSEGLIKDVTFVVKEEMGFEPNEVVKILLSHSKIWRYHPGGIRKRFQYLHNEVKLSHEDILSEPKLLLTSVTLMKARIGFLQHIGRAQFDPTQPNFVTFESICSTGDTEFVTDVCKSSVSIYNRFLKTV